MTGISGRVICFLLLVATCKGLELHLDLSPPAPPLDGPACGVLVCKETAPDSPSSSTDSSSTHTGVASSTPAPPTTHTGAPLGNISSMAVSRRPPWRDSGDKSRDVLATLTSQQPDINRVSGRFKVDGRLIAGRSVLLLELFNQEDCRADFTCQTRYADSQGRESVTTSHLIQQSQVNWVSDGHTPRADLQFLDLFRRMETKLAVATAVTETKLGSLELSLLERRIDEKTTSLVDRVGEKMEELEEKMGHLERSIVSKVSDQIVDKLLHVDKKVSASSHFGNVGGEGVRSMIEDKLADFHQQFENYTEGLLLSTIERLSQNIENNMDDTSSVLSALERNLTSLENLQQNQLIALKSLEDKAGVLGRRMDADTTLLEKMLNASRVNTNAVQTVSSLVSQSLTTDATLSSELKSVRDLLTPVTCKIGQALALSPPFPYPVVYPSTQSGLDVPFLCDTLTDGGGWVLIQRRASGQVDFYRTWEDYQKGFGSIHDDFWLGNDRIHALTSNSTYELRVEVKYQGRSYYAHYNTFSLGNEKTNYTLHLGAHSGTAGDALSYHKGRPFTTRDRDNDASSGRNCAVRYTGAWWYGDCHGSNLNGVWGAEANAGPAWQRVGGGDPMSYTEMKIRLVV